MSSDIAIKVENLSKCYQIYDTPRDRLKQFILPRLQRLFRSGKKNFYSEFWALKNVSFEVRKGEIVGIVGRNGSGKSTLLQMICGTINPTSGKITTNGRIAALLELGSGFNPEFTGRENVYLNGALLGLTIAEVENRFESITTFADIGAFIDQPVKAYSSGMVVRLAFAVAINIDPDILVVDEALSVGDELFQRKCFSRIEAIKSAGATILFVSHSGGTVVELCDRALLLDSGDCLAIGPPKKIVGTYHKLLYVPQERRDAVRDEIRREDEVMTEATVSSDVHFLTKRDPVEITLQNDEDTALEDSFDPTLRPVSTVTYESHGATIKEPAIFSLTGERVNNLTRGSSYFYRYRVVFEHAASNVRFGMMIQTTTGVELGGAVSAASVGKSLPFVTAGSVVLIEFMFSCSLNPGVYFLNAGVVGDLNGSEGYLHRLIDAAMFRVLTETNSTATGLVDFQCLPRIVIKTK